MSDTFLWKGELKVEFRPMADILGDFFTKPLQGSLFVWIQENILNLPTSTGHKVHIWKKDRWQSVSSGDPKILCETLKSR